MSNPLLISSLLILMLIHPAVSQDYDFEIPEEEKEAAIAFSGNLDAKWGVLKSQKESPLYRMNFFSTEQDASYLSQYRLDLYLNGECRHKQVGFSVKTFYQYTKEGPIDPTFFELQGSLNLTPRLSAGLGKRRYFWGKGYAFNPVGYVNTEKDPENPDLTLAGIVSGFINYNKSYESNWLQNLSLSCVIMPPEAEINDKFARADHTGIALKLYLLLRNIDIDVMMFQRQGEPQRYGLDFSTNVRTNLEIHGEVSYDKDDTKTFIEQDAIQQKQTDGASYLFGIRYLTNLNTTIIAEYYHDNRGLSESEFRDLLGFLRDRVASGDSEIVTQTRIDFTSRFQTRTFMRDYLYVKVSQPEPFSWLYSSIGAFTIYNLDDNSFTLSAQLGYKPFTNFEFLLWPTVLSGDDNSEYGSRQLEGKVEMWLRWFF
ncbi:MAG: hypothetical protein KAT58_10655 [candidate division Zixibacteria bacterium]|nr:hypothetical protein [candidate division Zixibacteria bacterium]